MKTKTYELLHPIHDFPAVADVVGFWREAGRNIGLELQFCDGHRCMMSYGEIAERKVETAVSEADT